MTLQIITKLIIIIIILCVCVCVDSPYLENRLQKKVAKFG
jgi:hypothetical protein